VSDPP